MENSFWQRTEIIIGLIVTILTLIGGVVIAGWDISRRLGALEALTPTAIEDARRQALEEIEDQKQALIEANSISAIDDLTEDLGGLKFKLLPTTNIDSSGELSVEHGLNADSIKGVMVSLRHNARENQGWYVLYDTSTIRHVMGWGGTHVTAAIDDDFFKDTSARVIVFYTDN